ncbi:hypothetical protein MHH60_04595 [Paenibacillus sp. FSL H7-0716]|jgi:hypothetical protein|uniref:Uncharacterized protein n=1 Tax=Paenibacillus odorifer TaxID=189426 RepID=A0A1R0YZC0_9BACL|nr:hypothetical protein [Paenibacillus odorifer]AWV35053.1 hypothetical protein CD191_21810 [Paenibacillus odorifer]OMC73151.1 hypothetical protein BK121_09695 [Paenibacillus odorifer]OMC76680.1 hypothetical protein BK125_16585 [Paenibacillus odorifer]OMD01205.1 hypothetical protein BJP46_00345 [Paenibacillus odorifer]OMD38703.1 hypothetical protein BSO21_03720 [Paenibacillus odorifer]
MSDFFNSGPNPNLSDPAGHKANHDVNAQKYHTEGVPGFWSEVTNLLIVVAIIAVIFLVIRFVL